MKSLLEKPTPGAFRAHCHLKSDVWEEPPAELAEAWRTVLAAPIPYGDAQALEAYRDLKASLERQLAPWSTYDKKRGGHGRWVTCALEFTDRAEYETHMREAHSGGVYRWDNAALDANVVEVRTYRPRMPIPVKLWRSPRLLDEGRPWVDPDAKKKEQLTETCRCGLVLELGTSEASRQYVREHLELCTGEAVAS